MSKKYFAGIDNGGTATKCVIYDNAGNAIASSSGHIPMFRSKDGRTERDTEAVWSENCRVISDALKKSGLSGSDIACVSLCGYGGGLGMLDASGVPVAPFVISTDSRADGLLAELRQNGICDRVYEYTMQRLWAGQPAVLLPWFKRHDAGAYERCAHVVMIKDYVRYRLTGCLGTEGTDASNTNLLNIHTKKFDLEIFEILGIGEMYKCFPEKLLLPCDVAGFVTEEAASQTGLCAGTPVAAGLYDVASCCLASQILDEETLCLIVGTWSISGHITKSLDDCAGKSTTLLSFLDNCYFAEESSPTSASNLDWFVDQFYGKILPKSSGSVYEQCDDIIESLDPADSDLIFLPYLYGSDSIVGGKGGFFNLSSYHTSEHVLLSIYEGILFSLLRHIHNLYNGDMPGTARLSGGASRSAVWCQMLADILDVSVEVMESSELGSLGCAICASIAVGEYASYYEAAEKMTRVRYQYVPNPKRVPVYKRKYALYERAIKALGIFCVE